MPRQFFDLVAEERANQRDAELSETLDGIYQSIEDVFAVVLSLSLATIPARGERQ